MDKKTRQQIALFRHGLIGDLVHRKVGERGLYALLRDKAERVYGDPGVPKNSCGRRDASGFFTTWSRPSRLPPGPEHAL